MKFRTHATNIETAGKTISLEDNKVETILANYEGYPFYITFKDVKITPSSGRYNNDKFNAELDIIDSAKLLGTHRVINVYSSFGWTTESTIIEIIKNQITPEATTKISNFNNTLAKKFKRTYKQSYVYHDVNGESVNIKVMLSDLNTMEYVVVRDYSGVEIFRGNYVDNFDALIPALNKDIARSIRARASAERASIKRKQKLLDEFKAKIANSEITTMNIIKRALLEEGVEFKEVGGDYIKLKNQFCDVHVGLHWKQKDSGEDDSVYVSVGKHSITLPFKLADPENKLLKAIIGCAKHTSMHKLNESLLIPVADATE